MDDKDLKKINTVDVSVTSESVVAHVHVLRQNGYIVRTKFTNYTYLALSFILGAYCIANFIQ